MIAGFNSMKHQLGLLPPQLNAPPPPPPILHPAQAATQAVALGQQSMRETIQAAQATRYVPPPSAPVMAHGWGSTMDQLARQQLNPYVAGALGGGGGALPNPMFSTAPAYGMYRPPPMVGGSVMSAYGRVPSALNPFAPTLPAAHFSTPAMQQLQVLRAYQAEAAATLGGLVEGGLGLGGAVLGGALGTALGGPIGGFIGSWAGQKLGGLGSNMALGVGLSDVRRGRQLQNTTAPWTVTGP